MCVDSLDEKIFFKLLLLASRRIWLQAAAINDFYVLYQFVQVSQQLVNKCNG